MVKNCNKPIRGDIVRFNDSASSIAAIWCYKNNITGVISERDDSGMFIINAGLGYDIWAKPEHINIIAKYHEIPEDIDV